MSFSHRPSHRSNQVSDRKLRTSGLKEMMEGLRPTNHVPEIVEFLHIGDYSDSKKSSVLINKPLFRPEPSQIVFEQYEPFQTYQSILYMRNNDNVPRRIKISFPDSPFFQVSAPRPAQKGQKLDKGGKVAAGMELCFTITFKPQSKVAYTYDLICVTEREKFIVPIICVGTRPCLDFPDEFRFDIGPVKFAQTKSFVARNVGQLADRFTLQTSPPFSVHCDSTHVNVGESVQVSVTFTPPDASDYEEELMITYESNPDVKIYMKLVGGANSVDVSVDKNVVDLGSQYISLQAHSTLRIQNRTDVPVKFEWKSFGNHRDEVEERRRLEAEISAMEDIEYQALNNRVFDADDDSDALSDDEGVPIAKRREISALTRKYKNLRKQLADDPLLFANDNFSIEPMTSEIWANSDLEVTINFLPSNAASYQTVAFLDITGRDNRLPVKLCGVGIGPKAAFSFDVLDVGDIFLGSVHNYQLELINRGDIAASWSLQVPDSPFDQNFSFEPKRGELATGETAEINVTFSSNILGEFSEHYIFALQGSQQTLSVHFKGHVVGPTFHFDTDSIKFGRISYEFLNSKVLSLFNTSEIPMTFNLRVPQDGKNLDKEFDILPSSGTIQPGDRKKIQIDFISNTVKVYNYFLTVDVEGVGDALLSLPITASCGVPNVILEKEEIPYGTSYLRYKYEKSITLTNKSKDLRARYEVLPQDKHSVAIAKYFAMHNKGVIEAGETLEVPLYLVCQKLGKIKMPIYIRISGSENPPLVPMVFALGVGPIITSNISEMKWGNVPCLKDAEKTLVLRNTCPIVAPFQAYIENARSKFRVNVGKGQLQPGQNVKLTVTALLDDIVNTSDELIIAVSEGDALTIPLLARGVGTTMHCDEALEVVDFSHQFTNNECKRRFLLENKGRRPQMLTWVNLTHKERIVEMRRIQAENKRSDGKGKKKSKTNKKQIDINSIVPCFTISPDQIELKPRTACYFTFIGKSLEAGPVEEMLRLESKVGKDQTIHKVFNTCFKANFIDPLLEMVENLDFSYTFSPSVPLSTQSKAITLKNVSSLELKFVLRTQPPFKVDVYEVELEPGSSTTVNVEFNPGYKSDRLSRKVEGKITVVYRDHPQKDSIAVNGEINFPNLDFDFSQINFGCILNDTTKSMTMTISNNSKIDTTYSWAFFENESDCRAVSTSRKPYIPINQVFDILPIRSFLKPGQSEKIEFVMYGHTNRSFKGKCVCEVEGGPDYDMDLIGEASSVSYKVDKLELDFGDLLHNRAEELEFTISNTGKVPFSFRVSTDLISRPGIVEVIPTSGRIFGKDKAKVVVRFCPVLPETIDEKLVLEVAHFEPVEIPVRGIGVYSSVSLSLPQTITEEWTDLMESAREYLLAAEESLSENSENLSETKRYKNENVDTKVAIVSTKPEEESTDQKNGDGPTDETKKPEDIVVAETSEATEIDTKNKTETDEIQLDTKETEIVESNEGDVKKDNKGNTTDNLDTDVAKSDDAKTDNEKTEKSNENAEKNADADAIPVDTPMPLSEKKMQKNEKIKPPQALMLVDVEREARRIQYLQHLQDQLEKNFSSIMTKQQNESVANQLFEDKKDDDDDQLSVVVPPTPPSVAPASVLGMGLIASNVEPYVIAEHYADFGNVITGSSRKKTFRITNRGKVPVSFCINNRKGSCGFTVEPEKVNRLPEGMSVDFTIKFKARKKLGPVEIEVPIEVKGGPSVMLSLRAIVTIPDLVIRPNVIDFRKVLVGHCKEIYVTLFNPAPVPTEWVLKIPTSGPMTKASSRFKLIPASGTLAPGQKEQVMIVFTPSSEQTYLYKMSFQLNSNKKRKTLTCKGIGKEFKFKFFPRMLKMEPMKPFEPPRDTIVTARNDCDYPVEFYSLDFDTQYKDEENMLISKGEFDEHGTLFIEPRQPGKQLELENVINIYDDADDTESKLPSKPFDRSSAANILIVGAPCSGKTSLAKHLSEKHGLTYISLSNLLETARNTQTSSWQFIKAALDAAEILATGESSSNAFEISTELISQLLWEFLSTKEFRKSQGIVIDGLLFTLSSSQEGSEYPNLRTAAGIPVEEDLPLASKVSLASSLVTLFGPSEYGGLSTVACQATNEVLEARLEEILLKISGTSVDNNIEPTEDGANVEINAEVKVEHSDVSPNEPSPEQIALKARVDRVKTSGALALYEKDRTTIESLLGSSKENVADGGTESNANSNSNTSNTLNFIHIDINQSQEECATDTSEHLGLKDAPEDDGFDPVPFPRDLQIIQKPSGRLKRPHVKNFCVMPFPEGDLGDIVGEYGTIGSSWKINGDGNCQGPGGEFKFERKSKTLLEDSAKGKKIEIQWGTLQATAIVDTSDDKIYPLIIENDDSKTRTTDNTENGDTQKDAEADDENETDEKSTELLIKNNNPTRWVVPPNSELKLQIRFGAGRTGKYDTTLGFEIVGGQKQYNLPVRGTCQIPSINSDPRNVFMNRIKSAPPERVSRKFVISRNCYEFGPLLAGKDIEACIVKGAAESGSGKRPGRNAEFFRVSNNSMFSAKVVFAFSGTTSHHHHHGKEHHHHKDQHHENKENGEEEDVSCPFVVDPKELELPVGETKDIVVWAFPQKCHTYKDTLICCVDDNHTPVTFDVSCIGTSPDIALDGDWWTPTKQKEEIETGSAEGELAEGEEPNKVEVEVETEDPAVKAAREAREEALLKGPPLLDFDRLLLDRREFRKFVVKNVCTISVAWKLDLRAFEEHPEFEITPTSGILRPRDSTIVSVSFSAIEEKFIDDPLNIKVIYSDNEGGLNIENEENSENTRVKETDVAVRAEAYKISTNFKLEDEEGNALQTLDFGANCVGVPKQKSFKLGNDGKYDVKFQFKFRRNSTKSVFSIDPMSIVVKPGTDEDINVTFLSKREVRFFDCKDILCKVIEVKTEEIVEDFDIAVSAQSVFSKFRLQPMRGINFGALKFGNSSSRKFELRNDGVFPFRYKVIQWENKVPEVNENFPNENKKDENGEPIPIAVDGENVLKCGQFTIEPACGTIMPNGIVLFEASFTAEGSQVFNEEFLIDTSNRDPSVGIEALRYNMSGESCVPALENKNFESIFEEQEVMRSIGPNDTLRRAFAEEDNTFTFGAIVPQMNPEGAKERFKITNPSKVRAIIRFSTTSTDDKEDNIFSVQPEMEEIPPHEHRYITVYFKPKKIQHYSATFKALVDDSEYNAENGLLEVQLTGQGTMPCITIMDPMTRSANGRVLLDFNKLQIGKSRTRSITVRNDGIVPCTVRLSVSGKSKQMFALKNSISSTLTLGTKAEEKVDLVFAPTANQDTPFAASLNVDVMSNKFDSEVVDLLGSSFAEDISFRNLPEKKEDELIFGEQDMDLETEGIQQSFTIVNHQSKPVKFEWANHRDFSFLPVSGHLSAHGSKEIIGTFSCQAEENKVMYEKEDIALTINSIQYNGSTVPETVWDSSQIAVTFDEEGKEVTNAIAEPEHEIIGEAKVVMLACTARADKVGYECDCPKSISFRDTLMFQKRNYKFVLKNPTQTVLKFDWQLDDESEGMAGRPLANVTGGITAPNPFEFEPSNGSIMPGDSQTICLSFKPIEADVFRYNCLCAMEGLSKDYKPLNITVIGRAQRPVCHFEISHSHYLAVRGADLPGPDGVRGKPLDPSVKIVEIDSLGTNVRNTKRFYVTNPMDSNYEFSWEPVGGATSMFRCIAAQGLVLSGKRFEMAFEYTPINVGTHESFWRFSIPQRNVSTIFLLVGKVGEPRVRFDMPSINFKHVLLRSRSTETLNIINDEHIPFAYSFDLSQFEGRDEKPAIRIQPARGVVPPNGKTPIQIMFVPTNEKHSNFNLSCSIKNKPTQLSVNVKGQGYAVHDRATLITSQNQSGNELSRRGINYVDFGDVTMNAIQTKDIVLTNTGEFNFEFSWSRLKHPMLTIEPAFGTVRKGARVPCKLTFNPKTECSLKHIKLTCTVAGSSSYVLQIDGRGTKAAVHFSQTEFDFGPIFVAPPGSGAVIQTRTETLRIVNNEMDSDMTIDCLYEKKPHLDVQCDTQVLSPHQSMEVPIIFTPKECKSYTEAVVFEINSLYTVNCIVRAEGTSMRLELADPSMRHIAFGSPTPGNDVERQIRIVNRSKVATKFELLEPNGKDGVGLLTSKNISFYPFGTQTLKPRESCAVELRFSPIGSMPPFNEVLQMRQEDGRTLTLCTVAGACLGVDARLDTECLPFGAVCSQSFIKRKVVLQNSGDVGTKYRWNSLFKPHFSIEPKEGYLDSHSQVIFEITFHPQKVSDDIRNESPQIMLEGSQPIGLTLTGSCVPQPEQEELNFESRVRETQVKTVTISNPTKMEWNLCAAFENEYWSGLDVLTIPAGSEGQYEVKYTPLTMTPNVKDEDGNEVAGAVDDDAKHNGLLFFALPNGKTASWKLIGVSTKPVVDELPEGTRLSTPCKETLIIALPVRNWLKEAQKFTVEIKVADEDEKEATFLRGAQTVVLPAMAKRQYKLSYTPWTVSDTRTTVTFRNEKTGEYFFYEFTLRSLSSEEANFILRLGSICRVPTTQLITVENPLPPTTVVNLPEDFWTCDDSNVRVKAVGELSGRPEGTFEVEYRPLVVGVKQATLMLNLGSVLGSFKYDLELIATEGAAESSLHFNVPLGESSKKIFRFKSFCPEAARYSCSVTDPLFFEVVDGVDVAAATSWNGIEGTVEVNFEPERLGSIQDKLIVKSPTGGEFMCLLNGECTPPLPRGPVDMKPGGSDSVVFKNVFNEEHTFTFSVDNDAFSVDVSEQKIPRHTEATVKVSQAVGTPADACGKLLITCSEIAGLPPWVVYIGGKN